MAGWEFTNGKLTATVNVRATDSSGAATDADATNAIPNDATLTITLVDVDEKPGVTGPRAIQVPENSTDLFGDADDGHRVNNVVAGTEVVVGNVTFQATDPEGHNVNISLMGDDGDLFNLSDAGVLSLKAKPNYENPTDKDKDNLYEVTLQATVQGSDDALDANHMVAVRVKDVDESPEILQAGLFVSGPSRASVAENSMDVRTYTATGPDADSARWSVTGDDYGSFTVYGSGESVMLMFASPPDFEARADADGDNVYEVTVNATDGTFTDTQDVTVTVTDEDDPGSVTGLPSSAMVGDVLTAMLDDEDSGVANTEWQWASSTTMGGTYADIDGASSASYTVADGDAGMYLRATASYNDAHGSQSAIGTVMVQAADQLLAEHDANKNDMIDYEEVVDALRSFLDGDPDVLYPEVIMVYQRFLGN